MKAEEKMNEKSVIEMYTGQVLFKVYPVDQDQCAKFLTNVKIILDLYIVFSLNIGANRQEKLNQRNVSKFCRRNQGCVSASILDLFQS